jgi:hypothetical protein
VFEEGGGPAYTIGGRLKAAGEMTVDRSAALGLQCGSRSVFGRGCAYGLQAMVCLRKEAGRRLRFEAG